MTFSPRPYQEEALQALHKHICDSSSNPCVVLPTGCHAKEHPILLFDGRIKPVEDIQVGDRLMGPDSKPRTVQRLCRGHGDMYLITPNKGDAFTVNGDHILSLQCTNEGKKKFQCNKSGGEVDNLSVRDYIKKAKSWKHLRKLYRTLTDFTHQGNLPIPPYIIGILLGDGCLSNRVSLTKPDKEVLDAFRQYAAEIKAEVREYTSSSGCPTLTLRSAPNLIAELDELDLMGKLSGRKFIPHTYLTASRGSRFELLAGLLDTDGHLSGNTYDFISKSTELASDVAFLARSLGLAATVVAKYCKCQTGAAGWYFRLCVSGDTHLIPCKIKRKKATKRKQKKNILRTGFLVEQVDDGDFYGFQIDGDNLYLDGNFTVHHNSGKSACMAWAIMKWKADYPGLIVRILAHRKELIQQNADELRAFMPDADIGIFAAGLGERNYDSSITYAMIDSIYKCAGDLPAPHVIFVDEAHRIPPSGEGKYRRFILESQQYNKNLRVVGWTATPFRMGCGSICHKDHILNEICYEAKITDLIKDGFLCPIRSKVGVAQPDLSKVRRNSGGDYIINSLSEATNDNKVILEAVSEAVRIINAENRKAVMFFCVDIEHCKKVHQVLQALNISAPMVTGKTPASERAKIAEEFKAGRHRAICNINVYTEGFNAKNVDCIVLLRPTLSAGLFAQMVGRGLRVHQTKRDCLVLDFGGCIEEHGPIDLLGGQEVVMAVCSECREVFSRAVRICPACGWEIPKREVERIESEEKEKRLHGSKVSRRSILSDQPETYAVSAIYANRHIKPDSPDSIVIQYRCGMRMYREWICLDHRGYPGRKAKEWWCKFVNDKPPTVDEALSDMFLTQMLVERIKTISVKKNGRFFEVTDYNRPVSEKVV